MMDVKKLRVETPACENQIHFNNAGASLMPIPVQQAIQNHVQLEADMGGYEAADDVEGEIQGFYSSMGKFFNCSASNIAFTSSATNSFARALSCIPFAKGDKILIATEDYISNQLAFLSLQKRFGVEVVRAESLPEGGIDLDDFKRKIDQFNPRLVSITHVPTNSGLVQPIEAVGYICQEREITYLVDACQSAGQLSLDVNTIHCDFLSGTFRKFLRGPRGGGFLYVNDSVLKKGWEPLFIDMRGARWAAADTYIQQKSAIRFEDWEIPYSLLLGSKAAVEYALEIGIDTIQERNTILHNNLRKQLASIGINHLDLGTNPSSIVTIYKEKWDLSKLQSHLKQNKINFSISYGEYAVIDFSRKKTPWALRLSPHYFNTVTEIERVVSVLGEFSKG